ncbi:AEC family transporter [Corynebacterium lipophiloflavum]|uniref:Transporter, auxin efflux carrier (AEC) family protein n=1 Tax=Corynebacterium lipophiloflavum (strain ATCC 700352 / DSM 44291 / CCUG 37336 / JCM 10383 / DMMZ 1944) TaxID=525263 RepID=C0XUG7_CORLD|nr:AEC family transporter [Corynebacterium lipophiloflavum]EEI16123.1 transporter, auxin efflux carrier (AEC) family protein [Corynebacterium lipophiloflavum DSM 44291]
MLDVLTGFSIIFTVIGVGFVLAQRGVIGQGEARLQFNRVAFWATTPSLIFSSVATSDTSAFLSPVNFVVFGATLATMAIFWVISAALFKQDVPTTMAGAASSSYFNSVNMGLPIAIYVIGDATYVVPALVMQMAVLSPFVIAGLNAGGGRHVRDSIVAGLTAPMVLAAVAGFVVSASGWTIPEPIMAPIKILGGASIPLILMSFGASLKGTRVLTHGPDRLPTLTATALKLAAMPIVAWAIGTAAGLEGNHLYAAVILAALPTAQNVYNYTANYRVGEIVARDTVFLTTFLSMPAMLVIAAVL